MVRCGVTFAQQSKGREIGEGYAINIILLMLLDIYSVK